MDELEAIVRKDRFELVKNTDVHVPRGEEIGAPEVPFRLQDMGTFVSEAGYLECRRTTQCLMTSLKSPVLLLCAFL